MRAITRKELILLAGLSATVYPENTNPMFRNHSANEIAYVKRNGVRITRLNNDRLRVVVGGTDEPTT